MGASVQVLPREPARVSTSGADPARSPPPERGSHQPTRPTRLEDSNLRAEQDWDRPQGTIAAVASGPTKTASSAVALVAPILPPHDTVA